MPDQPDASYYNVAGRRSAERSFTDQPAAHTQRFDPVGPDPRYDPVQRQPLAREDLGAASRSSRRAGRSQSRDERGLPGWLAVLLLIAIAGVCGLVDSLSGSSVRGVFNYGLVVASLVAIVVVKRRQMFPVVIAPPLVYLIASGGLLYIRSGGLHDRGKLIDAGTNWIVYGFPAIAGATAVVLVIAGVRMLTRR